MNKVWSMHIRAEARDTTQDTTQKITHTTTCNVRLTSVALICKYLFMRIEFCICLVIHVLFTASTQLYGVSIPYLGVQ